MPAERLNGTSVTAPLPANGERIGTLDLIRGVAVMGIVFANIAAFGQPFSAGFYPRAFLTPPSAFDAWGWLAQLVVIDGKLRGLFTILFGAGLVLFTDNAWTKGAGVGLQVQRLFWLLCFGALHYLLLWRGDILMSYALSGFLVLPFLRWSSRRLLVVGLIGYTLGAALLTAVYAYVSMVANGSAGEPGFAEARTDMIASQAADMAEERVEAMVIRAGDYPAFVRANASALPEDFAGGVVLSLMETVPLILIGMALYRVGFFTGRFDRRKLLWWSIAGLAVGAAATLLLGVREMRAGFSYYGTLSVIGGSSMLPRLPMILGLAGLLVLADRRAAGRVGERVRSVGRMAFTNYLGTSFVMLWVFHGFGLGLFGELDRMALYVVAVGMGMLMLLWSKPWLDRFRYGPLEWLWRCLTYGRVFALRREAASSEG